MSLWKFGYWLLTTVGVAGIIALLVLYPAILAGLWKAIKLVLSYRIGCALVAATIAGFAADYRRHDIEDEKRAAEAAAYEQKQVQIVEDTKAEVWKEIADATAANAVTSNEVKEFKDALPPVPHTGNVFLVGADAARLCRIAGKVECGAPRSRAKGVPKARRPG